MAEYLPIRALNRSQNIRIGGVRVTPTETAYVDISTAQSRKELNYHSSIGAIVVVGALSTTNSIAVITQGATTNQGSSATDLIVNTEPGTVKNRNNGVAVSILLTETTIATADATNPRLDLIQVNYTTGAVTKVTGTAAASPVLKAPEAGNLALAQVEVLANATGIANSKITDKRPFA
jgi:hypothetical protein